MINERRIVDVLPTEHLVDDQCSSITKGSIYHVKHNVHTTFSHRSGLTRNCMFDGTIIITICRYCVLTWWGRGLFNVFHFKSLFTSTFLVRSHKRNAFFYVRLLRSVHRSCFRGAARTHEAQRHACNTVRTEQGYVLMTSLQKW